jgi:hypothetical protein
MPNEKTNAANEVRAALNRLNCPLEIQDTWVQLITAAIDAKSRVHKIVAFGDGAFAALMCNKEGCKCTLEGYKIDVEKRY